MDRTREARRVTVAAVNGGGVSRRRQRIGSYRDSADEDGVMEMQEMGRLRDRGSKKSKDRDRSGRSKRKRGDRIMHPSNREEEEDSSSGSANDEDEEEDDASVMVRLPAINPAAVTSMPHNLHRKSFPMTTKAARTPAVWKAADEMMGVPVPRRARSSSAKRPQEFSSSGGGGGELIHRQASTSPARPSPSSTTPISPSSSSASVRKKMKPISGIKHRPPKMKKSSIVPEELEIEVAEVLFGWSKQEPPKLDPRDNGSNNNEVKLRVSSPVSISPQAASSQTAALPPLSLSPNTAASSVAPKRKRPRPVVRMEDDNSTRQAGLPALPCTSASSVAKMEQDPPSKTEASSPRSEKHTASPTVENGSTEQDLGISPVSTTPIDVQQDSAKPENNAAQDLILSIGESDRHDRSKSKEEAIATAKECPTTDLDVNLGGTPAAKTANVDVAEKCSGEVKFCIDLMVLPGKSSPDGEALSDYVANQKAVLFSDNEMAPRVDIGKREEVKPEKMAKQEAEEVVSEAKKAEYPAPEDFDLKKQIEKDKTLSLQLDFDKQAKDCLGSNKQQALKQHQKAPKIEPIPEKTAAQSVSLPLPMPVGGWPGSFPPIGYMGQVPTLQSAIPLDGSSGSSKSLQPPPILLGSQPRLKRCVTHGYIAQKIQYHQQLSRMNSLWPPLGGPAPVYGGKQYNLNVVPPSSESSILGNPLQGTFPARMLGPMQEKGVPLVASFTGHSSKDKPSAGNAFMEPAQRKQPVLQQAPHPVSTTNIPQSPAFVFPLNQQQVAAAAPAARSGGSRSNPGTASAAPSASSASSTVVGSGTGGRGATVSFNYPGLPPNEAQYMAILQNGAYPFPIPAHVGAPPQYRGSSAQAVPFFPGSFYSSQMLHPQQLQQQQQPHPQPSHSHPQNTSTSSGSSSSQKPRQQSERAPGGGAAVTKGTSHKIPSSKQTQGETGSENASTPSSRALQAQRSIYGHNMAAMAIHPQSFTLISPSGGGSHSEKQQQPPSLPPHQSSKAELATSQAFAMSFASFGAAAAPSMEHSHAIFQSLPEAARHGYQITTPAAGATQATQYTKPHHQVSDDGKSAGDSTNTSVTAGEERKMLAAGKSQPQHSLTFSRPDNDSLSRTLNIIHTPASGRRPASAAPSTSSSAATSTPNPHPLLQPQLTQQQRQEQFIKIQKQQQQFLQAQQQQLMNNNLPKTTSHPISSVTCTLYPMPDRLSASSTMANFPQALIQGSGATTSQSPQWKSRAVATPAPSASPASSSAKNQHGQAQGRSLQQQPVLTPGHHTQISFGMNSSKGTGGSSNPSLSSAAPVAVGSPQRSGSKNASGSPRSSSSTKAGPSQSGMAPIQQQQQAKKSSSSSALKSSPLGNSNAPSILGEPHMAPAPSASLKQQQQPQPQQQQQQFPQAQLFFSNSYMPGLTSQSNGGYYHQRRQPSEQPPQQQAQQNLTSSDPAKAAAASNNNMKGMTTHGLLQHPVQFAMTQSGSAPHPMMSATFPYMHAMPSVSVKPAEQKAAGGNNTLPSSGNDNSRTWQPEKR